MKRLATIAMGFLFVCLISCSKQTTGKSIQPVSSTESNAVTSGCYPGKWYGVIFEDGYPVVDTIHDKYFIADGIAHIPNPNFKSGSYFTHTVLKIPNCHTFVGDSTKFEVNLKNPTTGNTAVGDFDVSLDITGAKNTAHVTFIAHNQDYTSVGIGTKQYFGIPQLVYAFEDYTVIALELKDGNLNVYKSGSLILTIPYKVTYRLGPVQSIDVRCKGSGYIDWVKLYNSDTGAQLMQEDFNTGNTSDVQWY
jgi:hypothetical protein